MDTELIFLLLNKRGIFFQKLAFLFSQSRVSRSAKSIWIADLGHFQLLIKCVSLKIHAHLFRLNLSNGCRFQPRALVFDQPSVKTQQTAFSWQKIVQELSRRQSRTLSCLILMLLAKPRSTFDRVEYLLQNQIFLKFPQLVSFLISTWSVGSHPILDTANLWLKLNYL